MGKSYSTDLRERIIAFVRAGNSRRAAARHFGVSESFAVKLMQRLEATGTAEPARQGRPEGGRLTACLGFLAGEVEAEPGITMAQLAERLATRHGIRAAPAELSRFLRQHGFRYRKGPDGKRIRTRRAEDGARQGGKAGSKGGGAGSRQDTENKYD